MAYHQVLSRLLPVLTGGREAKQLPLLRLLRLLLLPRLLRLRRLPRLLLLPLLLLPPLLLLSPLLLLRLSPPLLRLPAHPLLLLAPLALRLLRRAHALLLAPDDALDVLPQQLVARLPLRAEALHLLVAPLVDRGDVLARALPRRGEVLRLQSRDVRVGRVLHAVSEALGERLVVPCDAL